jgi:hypothetical protein
MATNEPKWTRAALDVINNTYVVKKDLLYEYYPIECAPLKAGDKFIKLVKSPGIISGGTAIVGKQLYSVSLWDLLRRRINVSKQQRRSTTDDNIGERVTATKKSKSSTKSKADSKQSGSGQIFGVEVSEAADMAWEDQVHSLLQTIHTEEGEELEITRSTQSRQSNEGSTVSDLFEDPELD